MGTGLIADRLLVDCDLLCNNVDRAIFRRVCLLAPEALQRAQEARV